MAPPQSAVAIVLLRLASGVRLGHVRKAAFGRGVEGDSVDGTDNRKPCDGDCT
jgi:hypothetical protein